MDSWIEFAEFFVAWIIGWALFFAVIGDAAPL